MRPTQKGQVEPKPLFGVELPLTQIRVPFCFRCENSVSLQIQLNGTIDGLALTFGQVVKSQ
jgi:hypothetical protein